MKFFYALFFSAALLMRGADAVCGAGALVAERDGSSCICPSWSADDTASGTCAALTTGNVTCTVPTSTALAQANLVNLTDTTIQNIFMDGTDANIHLEVAIPAMLNRTYTQVGFKGLTDSSVDTAHCTAEHILSYFAANVNQTKLNCTDNWVMVTNIQALWGCGMAPITDAGLQSGAFLNQSHYYGYDVLLHVEYLEGVTFGDSILASAATDTRSVSLDYPIRLWFLAEYSATLVSDSRVFSQYGINWAILNQVIPKVTTSAGTANVRIAFTAQYPYTVTVINHIDMGGDNGSGAGAGGLTNQFPVVLYSGSTTAPVNSIGAATTNNYTLLGTNGNATASGFDLCDSTRDYAVSNVNNTAGTTCKKDAFWLQFSGLGTSGQCTFGTAAGVPFVYTIYYTVGCATGINTTLDCPFYQSPLTVGNTNPGTNTTTNNYVQFSFTSENFCTNGYSQNINNAIVLTSFKSVDTYAYTTETAAFRYGDYMGMRIDFTGIPVKSFYLSKLTRKYFDSVTDPGRSSITDAEPAAGATVASWNTAQLAAATTWYFASGAPPSQLGQTPALTGTNTLGLQLNYNSPTVSTSFNFTAASAGAGDSGLSFLFALKIIDAFLGTTPARGERKYLQMYAVVEVAYYNANQRRRRRQASDNGGTGSASSTISSIDSAPETAAVTPNSALRTAPAVALVLAIMSAVVLL